MALLQSLQPNKQFLDQHVTTQITGSNIDQLFLSKESNLFALKDLNVNLAKENDELKKLNCKLVERLEYLQNFFDQEASAKEFYFNYPPKPDYNLLKLTKGIEKEREKGDSIENPEHQKLKQHYEEINERDKRKAEQILYDLKKSFSYETDSLYEMISQQAYTLRNLNNQHTTLDQQFKNYYLESDRYLNVSQFNLKQLSDERDQYKNESEKYSQLYNKADKGCKGLEIQKSEHVLKIDIMTKENERFKKKISYYEEKYKFIDIGKMHEQVQFLTSKIEVSEGRRMTIEKELYDLRDRIMRATQKSSGTKALNIQQNDRQEEGKEGESKVKQKWKASKDLEETSKAFLLYLQNEIQKSIDKGSSMADWANRTSSMIDPDNDSYRD